MIADFYRICRYGYMLNDLTILVPNSCGVIVAITCVSIYNAYTTLIPWNLYTICAAILMVGSRYMWLGDANTIGSIGCVLSIVLTAAPLATLGTVLKDQSTESMPSLSSIIVMALSSTAWMAYG